MRYVHRVEYSRIRITFWGLQHHLTNTRVHDFNIFQLYFHGAMEVPDISKQRYTFYESDYTTIELVALEIITSEDVKK